MWGQVLDLATGACALFLQPVDPGGLATDFDHDRDGRDRDRIFLRSTHKYLG